MVDCVRCGRKIKCAEESRGEEIRVEVKGRADYGIGACCEVNQKPVRLTLAQCWPDHSIRGFMLGEG
jgi:hypothetical protein